MDKGEFLYEGKAKRIYRTADPNQYIVSYKDDATAFDGQKKGTITDKGVVNNLVSAHFFKLLKQEGVPTHFGELLNDREMAVRAVRIVPIELVVRNVTAGSLAKRLGLEEGIELDEPVVEYYYKSDELHDPLINCSHIRLLKAATPEQLTVMREMALKVNDFLKKYLDVRDIILVDFKLEFGITESDGRLILADEISPDTCRFWDKHTREKLDKDRFRRDLGGVEEAYQEILRRLLGDR
ncbi:MAG: phosphoribosylaminoimidazolesuccinocarboxamide synthase [Desulforudis sp.]|jgi:phosphoribosylaminoimidazole-succinocarboxamide synthase|nr:phosphoribosylaminoimidazolesuccinocarboxamide synthase [Clostridia bacterium]MDQ7792002.1 phosphoribosylaminoimidazolesuccinocarboxamide synthase [Clostridia bacterium]RJX21925.1 MAG: phosphoribosylaminoimidazolesuccinocarboxamide synthase [Desulforudis sp.]